MLRHSKLARSVRMAIVFGAVSSAALSPQVYAQEDDATADEESQRIVITGSRIAAPGVDSSSQILSIDEEALDFHQTTEIESIMRTIPAIIPADNKNVNNGTAGAGTIDLRGLGAQRNLIMLDGRRMVPFNFNGQVDSASIPTALIERVDVITGGASAVYGSDAIAGAINFVMKKDFEGIALELNHSELGENDGDTDSFSFTLGSNLDGGRGNAVVSMSWLERKPVLLGDRSYGLFGVNTRTGAGLDELLAGGPPAAPPAGCEAPGAVDFVNGSGSTTSMPTRFAIVGGTAASSGQFRNDGTISNDCSRFNFGPFNYYQTPAERYSATAAAFYEINEHAEVYSNFNFTHTRVDQQVAPSGTFGSTFWLPMFNPLIGSQAQNFMITGAETERLAGNLNSTGTAPSPDTLINWRDENGDGVVGPEDYLLVQLRRRTLELGPRTERFDTELYQLNAGVRGTLYQDWDYDVTFQYGESNRTTVRDGYTNVTNIQNALDTADGVTCLGGDSTCVPINLFGGFGTITDEMAAYARAIALQTQNYEQTIATAVANGPVDAIQLPWADDSLRLSVGMEHRREKGSLTPDECLKEAPTSCQGGAGGNLLPIAGGYTVEEYFFEGILPLVSDAPGAQSLAMEFGFRSSDYNVSDDTAESYKFGFNWRPVDQVLVRVMQQRANRAPNVGELASPVTTGLDNAVIDPCSVANAGNIDQRLTDLCISTGMTPGQVGAVQDIIANQINAFNGSDPNNLPKPEEADTFTAGIVWTPEFDALQNFTVSVDYYDIDIKDIIGTFSVQEILDACYVAGTAEECAKIHRVGGDLTIAGSGVDQFTTNLNYLRAEGVEVGVNFGFEMGEMGRLNISANINKYLKQESQSSDLTPVLECKGFFGTSCDPISDLRWVQRTTWSYQDWTVSAQWRHIGSIEAEPTERANVFEPFQKIDSYDYLDLFASYAVTEYAEITFGIDNVTDEDPPISGNDAGDTSSNFGNTWPSNYDVLGSTYKLGVKLRF